MVGLGSGSTLLLREQLSQTEAERLFEEFPDSIPGARDVRKHPDRKFSLIEVVPASYEFK